MIHYRNAYNIYIFLFLSVNVIHTFLCEACVCSRFAERWK